MSLLLRAIPTGVAHHALRVFLFLGGALMASRLGILFQPWQRATLSDAESTTTVAIAIGFGFVLIMASYDPVRYVIVGDASVITLLAFVAVALYSIVTFGFDATY